MELQDAAKLMLEQFETKRRDSGESFKALKDSAPDWMTDVCRDAHGRKLPDDFVFEVIVDSLNALVDYDDTQEANDSLEADFGNADLLAWVSSNLSRASYVNDAVQEFGMSESDFDLFKALQMGQLAEKQEIFGEVLDSLTEKLDEIEAA